MAVKGYDALINQVNAMIRDKKAGIAAINSVLAAQKKRIFQDGKASNESKIGTYSTTPISISKKSQAKNTGKTYFKGGYRQYKSLTGKGSSFVNLRNTDQMMMDLSTQLVAVNEFGIGFNFFFESFIFSPEIKISNGLRNLHSRDANLKFSNVFDRIQSKMIVFSIHLEG